MADRYWIASSASNWNNTANWSTTSGGSGGASVPGSGDTAIFDGNGLGDCDVSAGFYTVDVLDLQSGYTGQLYSTLRDFTVVSTLKIASGATIDFSGINFTLNASASIDTLDGTFTGTGIFRTKGTSTIAPGTFDIDVTFSYDYGNSTTTFTGDVIFQKDVEFTYTKGFGSHTIANNTNNPNLTFQGGLTLTQTNGIYPTWTQGTGTITLSGSANQSINLNSESVEDFDIDKTAGTATLTANVDPDSLTITAGTFDIDGNNMLLTGNLTQAAGTTVQDTAGGGVITVGGNFDVNGVSGNECVWNGPDLTITGTADVNYTTVSNSDASGGTEVDATPGGQATADSISDDTSADATGTATWFRAVDSDGNGIIDGDVTATGGGGDLELDSIAISAGTTVSVTSWTFTVPES